MKSIKQATVAVSLALAATAVLAATWTVSGYVTGTGSTEAAAISKASANGKAGLTAQCAYNLAGLSNYKFTAISFASGGGKVSVFGLATGTCKNIL